MLNVTRPMKTISDPAKVDFVGVVRDLRRNIPISSGTLYLKNIDQSSGKTPDQRYAPGLLEHDKRNCELP